MSGLTIHVVNGPNLNMLEKRQPEIYGTDSLDFLENILTEAFPEHRFVFFQTNHEGKIIDYLHTLWGNENTGLIINAGAFTHYSYAIFDALLLLNIPKIEVHISNIYKREAFRRHSVLSAACDGMIAGLGIYGYVLAASALLEKKQ